MLVVLKAATATLWQIEKRPKPCDGVGGSKNDKDPILEIIEQDWAQQRDGKIGKTPDDHRDSRSLRAGGRCVDLGGNEPGRREPANAKGARGDEERYRAQDGRGPDAGGGVVHGQAAKEPEKEEADGQDGAAAEEKLAAADGVYEDPGKSHEEEVGDVISLGNVLGILHAKAEKLREGFVKLVSEIFGRGTLWRSGAGYNGRTLPWNVS